MGPHLFLIGLGVVPYWSVVFGLFVILRANSTVVDCVSGHEVKLLYLAQRVVAEVTGQMLDDRFPGNRVFHPGFGDGLVDLGNTLIKRSAEVYGGIVVDSIVQVFEEGAEDLIFCKDTSDGIPVYFSVDTHVLRDRDELLLALLLKKKSGRGNSGNGSYRNGNQSLGIHGTLHMYDG